jgi:hypothetical protein
MKNEHKWNLNWTKLEPFDDVIEHWHAEGEMFALEVQEQYGDVVVGTVWKRIPATFWEPEDVACVHEQTYESVNEAKFLLEKFDDDAADDLRKFEEALERELRS